MHRSTIRKSRAFPANMVHTGQTRFPPAGRRSCSVADRPGASRFEKLSGPPYCPPMSPLLTDRAALIRNRRRASRAPVWFLHNVAKVEIQDRLSLVKKSFRKAVIVSGHPSAWEGVVPQARQLRDEDVLHLDQNSCDLAIHAMCLHWANDPVGQLVQLRHALRPDGLLLAVSFGGETLRELRTALAQAESELNGGLSPRVAPMAEIRDLGGVLQRAGFSFPVVDSVRLSVTYDSIFKLMRDLRFMGEGNALATRHRRPANRALFERASQIYSEFFSDSDERLRATFELMFLAGWSPDASHPRPLRPGSATARLADALGTKETSLKD